MNPNVQVDVVERLFHEGPELVASGAATPARQEVAGLHWRARGLIEVSLAPQYNPLDTAAHELWHSVEPMLTPQEQATLQRAFPETDSLSHEERTAYAFETWKKRKGSKPGVPPIFRKVSAFMRGVRNWLRGQGVKKAEDIFDTAERGEVGRRDFGPLSEAAQSPEAAQAAMAWHGSPHRFDKFKTEAIGTGRGRAGLRAWVVLCRSEGGGGALSRHQLTQDASDVLVEGKMQASDFWSQGADLPNVSGLASWSGYSATNWTHSPMLGGYVSGAWRRLERIRSEPSLTGAPRP